MRVAVAAWRFIWSICRSHSGRGIRSGNDHSAESAHQQLLIGHHVVDQRTAAMPPNCGPPERCLRRGQTRGVRARAVWKPLDRLRC